MGHLAQCRGGHRQVPRRGWTRHLSHQETQHFQVLGCSLNLRLRFRALNTHYLQSLERGYRIV